MRFKVDNSSTLKHYVEKDNYFIVENDNVLTMNIDGDEENISCFDVYCYLNNLNKNNSTILKVLIENPGRFVGWKSVYNFLVNITQYYITQENCKSSIQTLKEKGFIYSTPDGFYRLTSKYEFLNKDYKCIVLKFNNKF